MQPSVVRDLDFPIYMLKNLEPFWKPQQTLPHYLCRCNLSTYPKSKVLLRGQSTRDDNNINGTDKEVSDVGDADDDDNYLSDLNYFQTYQKKSVQCLKSIWLMWGAWILQKELHTWRRLKMHLWRAENMVMTKFSLPCKHMKWSVLLLHISHPLAWYVPSLMMYILHFSVMKLSERVTELRNWKTCVFFRIVFQQIYLGKIWS